MKPALLDLGGVEPAASARLALHASLERPMTTDTDPLATLHEFLVLINAEAQYSLWPADVGVPAGWSVVHQAPSREDAIAYVDSHWTDMRPASLRT